MNEIQVVWTKHAEERQKEWEIKLGIKRSDVESVLMFPEQIQTGDQGALVAQSRFFNGLLRIPFIEIGNKRKILTIYWTSKAVRYWKE